VVGALCHKENQNQGIGVDREYGDQRQQKFEGKTLRRQKRNLGRTDRIWRLLRQDTQDLLTGRWESKAQKASVARGLGAERTIRTTGRAPDQSREASGEIEEVRAQEQNGAGRTEN
jgi:hypothetical protein